MQLDKTRITVRERGYLDTLDLALRVVRSGGRWLLASVAAGVVPVMLFNYWLLFNYREAYFQVGWQARYMMWTLFLVAWEMPLATAPATLYLGHVLFDERPRAKTIARCFLESLPQLLIFQGLLRFLFVFWSYLNEVILLERNPLRATSGGRSTFSRCRTLHRGESSDAMAGWLGTAAVGGLLVGCIWGSMIIVHMLLASRADWNDVFTTLYFPVAIWGVAGYFSVVRFLSYLDLRIRREGWEVELLMRAERIRLEGQWELAES